VSSWTVRRSEAAIDDQENSEEFPGEVSRGFFFPHLAPRSSFRGVQPEDGIRNEPLDRQVESMSAAELHRLCEMPARVRWLHDVETARAIVKRALDLGEFVLACEVAREGLKLFPKDLLLRQRQVIALAQMGSIRSAQKLLDSMIADGAADSETLSLLGRTWKDDWLASRDAEVLKRSRDAYERAYAMPSTDPAYPGINVATLALLAGDTATAQRVAEEVRGYCEKLAAGGPPDYWNQATLAEALAVLGRIDEAAQAYGEAVRLGNGNLRELSSTRRQARLIAQATRSVLIRAFPT
jgi:tetratricopeptide (TPR) repeat protein